MPLPRPPYLRHLPWAGDEVRARCVAAPAAPFSLLATAAAPTRRRLPHVRSNNSLTGTLDPSLGRAWPMMEDLHLATNELRGPIPPSFAAMGRLNRLALL